MYARHALPRSSSCSQNLLKLGLCACVATVKFRIEQGRSIYCGSLVKKCNNPHRRQYWCLAKFTSVAQSLTGAAAEHPSATPSIRAGHASARLRPVSPGRRCCGRDSGRTDLGKAAPQRASGRSRYCELSSSVTGARVAAATVRFGKRSCISRPSSAGRRPRPHPSGDPRVKPCSEHSAERSHFAAT